MMVSYSATADFFSSAMYTMGDFRHNGSFCDVTLTVGQDQVQAHRCVLASSSQYFHSLFLGKFVEASMETINLSEVTNNVKALEHVIDFMYSGKISISDNNLGVIVKLATFFLIEPLREFCIEYMYEFLNLRNCLRMYLYAVEHSLPNIEKEAKLIVISRFHDYVILEESLDLSPDEVLFLLSNNIFQHCSASSILHFVVKWLSSGITDQHIPAANQVLDNITIKNIGPAACSSLSDRQKTKSVQMLAKLRETLEGNRDIGVEKLLKKSQQILAKLFPIGKSEGKNYNLRLGTTPKKSTTCIQEEVVLALSPRQCVMDAMDQQKPDFYNPVTYTEPVFTLYCYTPRTKAWYYIRDFEGVGIMADIAEELYFGGLVSAMYKEELVLLCNAEDMHFYNLRNKVWRTVYISDVDDAGLTENEMISGLHDCCIVSGNDRLYVIMKVSIYDDLAHPDTSGEYFCGLKLNEDGETWTQVFKTQIEREHVCSRCEIQATISPVSNELLFTHGPNMEEGNNYVYIVNLNDPHPEPVNVCREFIQVLDRTLTGISITQTKTHFYIMCDGNTFSGYDKVRVMYECKFNSLTLATPVDEFQNCLSVNRLKGSEEETFPCLDELALGNGKSLWSFEGYKNCVSFLNEVVVYRHKNMTYKEHTPPPFSRVTDIFVGELPTDLLHQMTLVERFVHNVRE